MSAQLADYGARLIFALRFVDKAFNILAGVRSTFVLAMAPETVLDRYNDVMYSASEFYRPDSANFHPDLFPWEQRAIERFFPPPPARVLIGAAGGGREALVLARRGYEVVAFEPAQGLVEAMVASIPGDLPVSVYRARYVDLPRLFSAKQGGPTTNLETIGPFDASIMGWGSFAHLRSEAERVAALNNLAQATRGPILISFYIAERGTEGAESTLRRLRRIILERSRRDPGDRFSMNIGFYHAFSAPELARLIRKAGLKLVYLNAGDGKTTWPHAVLISMTKANIQPNLVSYFIRNSSTRLP